jgi:hypothetical protein
MSAMEFVFDAIVSPEGFFSALLDDSRFLHYLKQIKPKSTHRARLVIYLIRYPKFEGYTGQYLYT